VRSDARDDYAQRVDGATLIRCRHTDYGTACRRYAMIFAAAAMMLQRGWLLRRHAT